jgi:chorismate-pyruvate lyase
MQGAILWVVECPVQQADEVQQRRVVLCNDHSAVISAASSLVLCSW